MKDKKLICVLTNSNFDSKQQGFIHTENKSLVKAGFDVKSITFHRPGTLREEIVDSVMIKRFKYLPERFEIKTSIQQEVNKSKLGLMKALLIMVGFFVYTFSESLKQKPDLFLAHWAFPTGYIAHLLSRIFRKKCIIEIHGSEGPLIQKSNFLQWLLIPSMNNSALITANSNYLKNIFISMGVKKEKIVKIDSSPSYVKHNSDSHFLKEFRKKITHESQKILLFAGNLIELKGAQYAIKSLTHLQNKKTHLIIAGKGVLEDGLKKLTKSLDLEDRVTFFGLATPEEMGWLHDISDIFVCPSIIDSKGFTDNLPRTIYEAMESGLPVIATNVGGIPELIEDEKTGLLVQEKDPIAIAQAVDQILSDSDLRKRMIVNSKQIMDEFSLEKLEKKYIDIILSVVNKSE